MRSAAYSEIRSLYNAAYLLFETNKLGDLDQYAYHPLICPDEVLPCLIVYAALISVKAIQPSEDHRHNRPVWQTITGLVDPTMEDVVAALALVDRRALHHVWSEVYPIIL